MKRIVFIICLLLPWALWGGEREYLWTRKNMPDAQSGQIAAMSDKAREPGFQADKNRIAFIEWFDAPAPEVRNGGCAILISGGSYNGCVDGKLIRLWKETFTALGFQCVNLVYRTPRPEGLPIYQTAWEDGQRAVRLVRGEALRRGINPENIGVVGMSAGSHLGLLLATSSQTRAYAPVDKLDSTSCHVNWAILHAPAYVTTDGEAGIPASRDGYGADVSLSKVFRFDAKTCPMSLQHGGLDPYSPNGSTLVYRQLRRMGIPSELHLYPGRKHGAFGLERGIEFLHQLGFSGTLAPKERLMDRYASDAHRAELTREPVWAGRGIPDLQENQCEPYIEWHIPAERRTDAIQIIYSGGSYQGNDPDGFEVAPVRRYLNARGMTVVTLKYRTPRPLPGSGLAKHTTAWQDLQRAIRLVRSEAASKGLNPDKIGIMGSSAGGHLTVLGVTSSRHNAYLAEDEIDRLPCNVQWGIGIYPAYCLTDNVDNHALHGGNEDTDLLVGEFSFDLATAPMLFLHGDADPWPAMNSVKIWEKMRAIGIQSELHTLALQSHCFQREASPGTGAYNWMERISEYLAELGILAL